MLAQNFKTADELGLTAKTYEGLKKVLVRLETNDLVHQPEGELLRSNGFNMAWTFENGDCGTVACIGGWTAYESGQDSTEVMNIPFLTDLFYPRDRWFSYRAITTEQAAQALRNYLTTGKINWDHLPSKF